MPFQLPSSENIQRQAPSTARQVVSYTPDQSGTALARAGESIASTGINVLTQQAREQEIQAKELTQSQTIAGSSNFKIAMNDIQNTLHDDPDYATHGKRFEELGTKALEQTAQGITDQKAREDLLARGRLALSEQKQQVLNRAFALRDDAEKASVMQAVAYGINNYAKGTNRIERERNKNIALASIATREGKSISRVEAQNLRSKVNQDTAYQEIAMRKPEEVIAILDGKAPQVNTTGNPVADEAIMDAHSLTGAPLEWLLKVASIESGGNPSARSPSGKHFGLFQFGDDAAKDVDLQDRLNPRENAVGMGRRYFMLEKQLTDALGRKPSGGEVYLAHQQGGNGAIKLLSSPDEKAVDVVGRAEVLQNGGNPDMTAAQFANRWTGQFDGSDYQADRANLTPEMEDRLRRDAQSQLGYYLKKDITNIENARALGKPVDRSVIEATATKAREYGMGEVSDDLMAFADIQGNVQTFALQGLSDQKATIDSFAPNGVLQKPEDAPLLAEYMKVYDTKVKAVKDNPWGYYEQMGVIQPVKPLDYSGELPLIQSLDARREQIRQVNEIEHGAVPLPLLTPQELDQIKVGYDSDNPDAAIKGITMLGQSMSLEERRATARAAGKKYPVLGAALAHGDTDIAKKILLGSKLEALSSKGKVRESLADTIDGKIVGGEQTDAALEAATGYYTQLQAEKGILSEDDPDTKVIKDVVRDMFGETVELDNGDTFSFKGKDGEYVSEVALQDAVDSLTDDNLKEMFGALPRSADGEEVTAAYIRRNISLQAEGDGFYVGVEDGNRLETPDGKPYVFDMRKMMERKR